MLRLMSNGIQYRATGRYSGCEAKSSTSMWVLSCEVKDVTILKLVRTCDRIRMVSRLLVS